MEVVTARDHESLDYKLKTSNTSRDAAADVQYSSLQPPSSNLWVPHSADRVLHRLFKEPDFRRPSGAVGASSVRGCIAQTANHAPQKRGSPEWWA